MRLHRNLVFAVIQALDLIYNEQEYADKVVLPLPAPICSAKKSAYTIGQVAGNFPDKILFMG